jgi:FAD/FMN-containing dehydrogenase/Fe-S oxidoreductase
MASGEASGDSTSETRADTPASDDRADYDYRSDRVARPGPAADIRSRIDGDVRFDEYTRNLYATDASAYEVLPVGVVFPRSTADVRAVVTYCAERSIPVLPRGGGTSLAGQSVNEAVVLDCTRYMDDLLAVDADGRTARAQPGVLLGDLNDALAPEGLKFAPDPAWGDKSALGGAIGNNSTGAHSLQYGKTDHYVEECEVVLADGTVTTLGAVSMATVRERADPDGDCEARLYAAVRRIVDEEADAVEAAFPDLKRNVSGYNLDRLLAEANGEYGDAGTVNLARLLAGSEGTLAVVTEATVSLEPIPETKALALLSYESLGDAMADVVPILDHDPAAVEVLDDVLLDLAGETGEFAALVDRLRPSGADAVLLVEFYADDDAAGRRKVADLLADRGPGGDGGASESAPRVRAIDAKEAHDDEERARFWKLRKSGLPILLGRTGDEKHVSFIEDTAVPPSVLPEFVADFQQVLDDHDTFASFYAHAGPGCLHIRPLINTKTVDGIEQMEAIADAATDLVVEYGGSVSGEHGDGRARTQWNYKMYGPEVWDLFRALKRAVDPGWLLNPGQVCGYDEPRADHDGPGPAEATDLTENLRFDADYEYAASFEPTLNYDENDMEGLVELCHGCGGCRGPQSTTGGVMCPTYRATDEEITSTRGRANALRQAMSGDLPADPTDEEFRTEVLDLCIGCKGCLRDCPSEVDMAKLKAEVEHAAHQQEGADFRDRLFANVDRVSAVGSALAPVSNWLQRLPGTGWLAERTLGIARERKLPTFRRETFADWLAERAPAVGPDAERRVLMVPDTTTNYSTPAVGKAAVAVLEAAGVRVEPADVGPTGRAAHSKGFLDVSRERARETVERLVPEVDAGADVVLLEPSDAVMLQHDYLDLLGGDGESGGDDSQSPVERVAANTYGVCEYLDRYRLDEAIDFDAPAETLTYHGHCHQTAIKRDHHAVGVLRRAGYEVDSLDSGCCGMAGSFGYEAEHYSLSQAIGAILFEQVDDSPGETVVAPGASCRTQLGDREAAGGRPPHPIEKLHEALAAEQ